MSTESERTGWWSGSVASVTACRLRDWDGERERDRAWNREQGTGEGTGQETGEGTGNGAGTGTGTGHAASCVVLSFISLLECAQRSV